jgi:hypothetical protein
MASKKIMEREVQDRFFDIITNQKNNTPSNAFKVYQKLVYYRYSEIITSTFIQYCKNLSQEELDKTIFEFMKNPPKTEFVWKIANDYRKFVKKQKYFEDKRYMYELLYFDWIEVEIYMKEYKEKKVKDLSWNNKYKLSQSARIKKFKYDVINGNYEEKRENFLIIYFDFNQNEVLYREINQVIYALIKKLDKQTIKSTLKELCKDNDINYKEAKTLLLEPLNELVLNKALIKN